MMRLFTLLLCSLLWANQNEFSGNLQLQVLNTEEAMKLALAKVEAANGHLKRQDPHSLQVIVPRGKAEAVLDSLANLGKVIDRNQTTSDLFHQIQTKKQKQESIEGLLKNYWDLMDSTGTEGVLEVEREIRNLTNELELLQSQITQLENRVHWSTLNIRFSFQNRYQIRRDKSPFTWINQLNLTDLMKDFTRRRMP